MSDERSPEDREVLEQQLGNLRGRVKELEGIVGLLGNQLQLCVQMCLRHDWTFAKVTNGQLVDRDAAAGGEGEGVVQVKVPVPEKDWVALLMPVRQSKILTAGGGRALVPPAAKENGSGKPKLVTE